MISDDLKKNYEEVLKDLHTRRAEQARVLAEIDQTITGIAKLIQPELTPVPSPTLPFSPPISRTVAVNPTRFAHMSVRWAILLLLESATAAMSSSEIAEALLAGGIESRASNFNNNVSAVLSDMKNVRSEVEVETDGKWKLTSSGGSAALHIRTHRLGR